MYILLGEIVTVYLGIFILFFCKLLRHLKNSHLRPQIIKIWLLVHVFDFNNAANIKLKII